MRAELFVSTKNLDIFYTFYHYAISTLRNDILSVPGLSLFLYLSFFYKAIMKYLVVFGYTIKDARL
jgi:hypothetical protein